MDARPNTYDPPPELARWEKQAAQKFDSACRRLLSVMVPIDGKNVQLTCQKPEDLPMIFFRMDQTITQRPQILSHVQHWLEKEVLGNPDILRYLCRPSSTVRLDADSKIISSSALEESLLREFTRYKWLPKIPYRCDSVNPQPYKRYFDGGTNPQTGNMILAEIAEHLNAQQTKAAPGAHGAITPTIHVIPAMVHEQYIPNIIATLQNKPINEDLPLPKKMRDCLNAIVSTPDNRPALVLAAGSMDMVDSKMAANAHAFCFGFLVNPKAKRIERTIFLNSWQNAQDPYLKDFSLAVASAFPSSDPVIYNWSTATQINPNDKGCGLHAAANVVALAQLATQEPEVFYYHLKLGLFSTKRAPIIAMEKPTIQTALLPYQELSPDIKTTASHPDDSQWLRLHAARWEAGSMAIARMVQEKVPHTASLIFTELQHVAAFGQIGGTQTK